MQVVYDEFDNVAGVFAADILIEQLSLNLLHINIGSEVGELRQLRHPLSDKELNDTLWVAEGNSSLGRSRGWIFEPLHDLEIHEIGALAVADGDCQAALWEYPGSYFLGTEPVEVNGTRRTFSCIANQWRYVDIDPVTIRTGSTYAVVVTSVDAPFFYSREEGYLPHDSRVRWLNSVYDRREPNSTESAASYARMFPDFQTSDSYSVDFGYALADELADVRLYILERSDAKFVACSSCEITHIVEDDLGENITLLIFGDESEDETISTTTRFLLNQSDPALQDLTDSIEVPRQLSAPLTFAIGLTTFGLDWATILTVPRKVFYGSISQRQRYTALSAIGMIVIVLYFLKLVYDELQPQIRYKAKRKKIVEKIGIETVTDADLESLVSLVKQTQMIYRLRDDDVACPYYELDHLAKHNAGKEHDTAECAQCSAFSEDHKNALLHMTMSYLGFNSLAFYKLRGSSKFMTLLRRFHMTDTHTYFMHAVFLTHVILQFWKPNNFAALREAGEFLLWVLIVEGVCLFVEILDHTLSLYIIFRLRNFHEDDFLDERNLRATYVAQTALIFLLSFDYLLMWSVPFTIEYYLPIRALLLVALNQSLRRSAVTLLRAIFKAKTVLLLYGSLILTSALMCLVLFRNNHDAFLFAQNSFGNFVYALITMVIYFTGGSNFTDIWYAESEDNGFYVIFFMVLAIIGLFFVMAIVTGFFQQDFKRAEDDQRRFRRLVSRTGIVAAFLILADTDERGDTIKEKHLDLGLPPEKDALSPPHISEIARAKRRSISRPLEKHKHHKHGHHHHHGRHRGSSAADGEHSRSRSHSHSLNPSPSNSATNTQKVLVLGDNNTQTSEAGTVAFENVTDHISQRISDAGQTKTEEGATIAIVPENGETEKPDGYTSSSDESELALPIVAVEPRVSNSTKLDVMPEHSVSRSASKSTGPQTGTDPVTGELRYDPNDGLENSKASDSGTGITRQQTGFPRGIPEEDDEKKSADSDDEEDDDTMDFMLKFPSNKRFVSKENVEAFERYCGTQLFDKSMVLKRGDRLSALQFLYRMERISVPRLNFDRRKKIGGISDHFDWKSVSFDDRMREFFVKEWWNKIILACVIVTMWLSSLYGSISETSVERDILDTVMALLLIFQVVELLARFLAYGPDYLFWSLYPVLWDPESMHFRRTYLSIHQLGDAKRSRDKKHRRRRRKRDPSKRQQLLREAQEQTFANRFDTVVLFVAAVLFVVSRALEGSFLLSPSSNVARFITALPILRVFVRVESLRQITYVLFGVLPSFTTQFILLMVVFYVYAVYGTAYFSGGWSIYVGGLPPRTNFETLAQSFIALFIFLVGGFSDTMFAVVQVYGVTAVIYFLTFLFLVILLFSNLFFSLVLGKVNELLFEIEGQSQVDKQNNYTMALMSMVMDSKGKKYPLAKALDDIKQGRVKLAFDDQQDALGNLKLHMN